MISTLNLGILAHVDAGKTTLTERLLFAGNLIDKLGSVDKGTTHTDSLALERQRGITIKSAVVSFVINETTVNLIDTPGHPDFIAEVERVLSVLDGCVLVISAVEGVQSQTRILMRTLGRLGIPTLIFVNKIDRSGARYEGILEDISERLSREIIPMGWVDDLGTRDADFRHYGVLDVAFTEGLADLLADHNEALLAAYVNDEGALSYDKLCSELAAQTGKALIHPVFFGSAITGAGVDALMNAITELLPASEGDADGPISGTVFKVERGPSGEKIAYVRMFSGTLRVRDRVHFGEDEEGKVTAIDVFEVGSATQSTSVGAGQIGKLWGLGDIQIGDSIGAWDSHTTSEHNNYFAPPTLETVVVPHSASERGALHVALGQLAEQDPLINLRQDDIRQELYLSLYGEVQKEIIGATLANEYDIEVEFRETTPICVERPTGSGEAVEMMGEEPNPFLATVGLRIEPAPKNNGVEFRVEAGVRSIPLFIYKTVEDFQKAMKDTVHKTLRQGLYGWEVTDCTVTMTHSGYSSPGSTAGDFRNLTPLVLMSALKQAGTVVCEPIHRFYLEVPPDTLGQVLSTLARLHGVVQTQKMRDSSYALEGEIPAARVHELQQQLRALTHGEGVMESDFHSYRPVRGEIPTRPRTDYNPLNRKEYLLHLARRV